MFGSWKDRLALLGGVGACAVAAQVARVLWLRAQLSLGPEQFHKYKGHWALVTGGSEGIGKACAAALAKQGLNVVLVSRSQDKLDAAAAEIKAKHPGIQVRTIASDLTKADNCKRLLQQLSDTPIYCLIANAGGGVKKQPAPYWEYADEEEAHIRDLNGQACYLLVKGLLPGMIQQGSGALVAISSGMYRWGALAAAYGAEKAKINALMESLDAELKLAGVPGVSAQAMVIGGVMTPGYIKMQRPELIHASPTEVAAAVAAARTSVTQPPADVVGEAIVRAIGRGGPLVTPYWGHWLQGMLLMDLWWPPSLQRAVKRALTRYIYVKLTGRPATDLRAVGGK